MSILKGDTGTKVFMPGKKRNIAVQEVNGRSQWQLAIFSNYPLTTLHN
jgi:hypothetical protein